MRPDRWAEVEALYRNVASLPPEQRTPYLDRMCPDPEMRTQVEWLLATAPPEVVKALAVSPAEAAAKGGERYVGAYRILGTIARGGMGVILRAEDTRLGRAVALKFLPDEFARDPRARERFYQEARAASALNHPHICTIYDVGEEDGHLYLVMELLEGQSLRHRLQSGPLPEREILSLGIQAGSALAAAHEAGIVHRDIKPENIYLTNRGLVKILDFGIAKLSSAAAHWRSSGEFATTPGMVMGTVEYMSPEQALGQVLDGRSDIFSLGAVLYEAATARQPFEGETPAAIFDGILRRDPEPIPTYNAAISRGLEQIIRRALAKDPDQRYLSAGDLAADLQFLQRQSESAEMLAVRPPSQETPRQLAGQLVKASVDRVLKLTWPQRALAGLAVLVVLAAAVGVLIRAMRPSKAALTQFRQLTSLVGEERHPSLSPDGEHIVFAAKQNGNWDLFLARTTGQGQPINLTAQSPVDDTQPAFSPDGTCIAFRSERQGGGLFLLQLSKGQVTRLSEEGFNPAWSPDGQWVAYATESIQFPEARERVNSSVHAVHVESGARRILIAGDAVQPQWSPDGKRLAFWSTQGGQRNIYTVAVPEDATPRTLAEAEPVTNDHFTNWSPAWSPGGDSLYYASDRGGTMNLWEVAVDRKTGRPEGKPRLISTPSPYSGHLAVAASGARLAYIRREQSANLQTVGFDAAKETVDGVPAWLTTGSGVAYLDPDPSPDGRWLAFREGAPQEDIGLMSLDGKQRRRLTNDQARDRVPRWSPQGLRLIFYSNRSGRYDLWMASLDGAVERITDTRGGSVLYAAWAPDGRRIVFNVLGELPYLFDVVRRGSPDALPPMPTQPGTLAATDWSPDGQKIAGFVAGGAANAGIYTYDLQTRQYERLTQSGRDPVWLKDSRRLLFRDEDSILMLDTRTRRTQRILSVAPNSLSGSRFSLSRDNRHLFYSVTSSSADVWLIEPE